MLKHVPVTFYFFWFTSICGQMVVRSLTLIAWCLGPPFMYIFMIIHQYCWQYWIFIKMEEYITINQCKALPAWGPVWWWVELAVLLPNLDQYFRKCGHFLNYFCKSFCLVYNVPVFINLFHILNFHDISFFWKELWAHVDHSQSALISRSI